MSIWQAIGAVMITLGLLWVASQAWALLWMMIIASFFSLALLPAVNWLHDRKSWSRGAALRSGLSAHGRQEAMRTFRGRTSP